MSSKWTHPICATCYNQHQPGRDPTTVIEANHETCCFCGKPTKEGIYYRYDSKLLTCDGEHEGD